MPRIFPTLIALVVLTAHPLPAQTASDSTDALPAVAGSYWTIGGMYFAENNEYELMMFGGQSWPLGETGGWTIRAGLGAGVSFWGVNDTGFLGGPQLTLERMLTGDRLVLNNGRPLELYALAGGSAYAGWQLPEAPQETRVVPAASAGLGLRWRGAHAGESILTLELYYEERFEDFEPRLFLRLDYSMPRGITATNRPSREQP